MFFSEVGFPVDPLNIDWNNSKQEDCLVGGGWVGWAGGGVCGGRGGGGWLGGRAVGWRAIRGGRFGEAGWAPGRALGGGSFVYVTLAVGGAGLSQHRRGRCLLLPDPLL